MTMMRAATIASRMAHEERRLFLDLCTFRSAEARERYRLYLVVHDPPRARLLELDARAPDAGGHEDAARRAEVLALLKSVDAEWFDEVRRRLDKQLLNCGRGGTSDPKADPRVRFGLVCPERWDGLERTEHAGVRFCEQCERTVHACQTASEVATHARAGHCVAVPSDLVRGEIQSRTRHVLGRPDGMAMWADDLFKSE